jgi:hypothetical protein
MSWYEATSICEISQSILDEILIRVLQYRRRGDAGFYCGYNRANGLAQYGMNPRKGGFVQAFDHPIRSVRARVKQQVRATPAGINLVGFIYQYVKELKAKFYSGSTNIRCNSKKSGGVYVYRYDYPFINVYTQKPLPTGLISKQRSTPVPGLPARPRQSPMGDTPE